VQDAQEFSKLFMALLETDPVMCQFIQQQFMGKYAYLTWLVHVLVFSLFGFNNNNNNSQTISNAP